MVLLAKSFPSTVVLSSVISCTRTLQEITISNVLIEATEENPPTFLAESIEKLSEEEANDAPEHLRRMIHFAALAADQQGSKKTGGWTEDISPANAGKCRRLGKSPTDEPLDMYEPFA